MKAFIQNLVQNGLVVSEKIRFEFLYVHTLHDLDLQYSHTFMKSISCLYLPTFRSQASIIFNAKFRENRLTGFGEEYF